MMKNVCSWGKKVACACLGVVLLLSSLPNSESEVKAANEQWSFNYTGGLQTFKAPYSGKYKIEMYGASGGGASASEGGKGGYTEAVIKLNKDSNLYLMVGQQGSINGGASYGGGGSASGGAGSGGGASAVFSSSQPSLKSAVSTGSVLMVAGGGGGKYSTGTSWQFRGGPKIGSAGGESNNYGDFGVHTFEYSSDLYGKQDSQLSNDLGQGQNGSSGHGAGGGGYKGGGASNTTWSGGAGGSGFVMQTGIISDGRTSFSQHIGNGSIVITYLGTYNVSVQIILDSNGSFKDSGVKSSYTFEVPCGSTFDFPDAVPADSSVVTFTGYTVVSGDLSIYNQRASIKLDNVVVQANFTGTGISLSGVQNGNKVKLNWNDATSNIYYSVFSGVDVDSADEENDFEVHEGATEIPMVGSVINIAGGYTVPQTGYYTVTVTAGQGGSNWGASGSHSNHTGAKGQKVTAQVYLKAGEVLSTQTYAGGSGTNNTHGGSGGGGTGYGVKATNPKTGTSEVIIAAGGGSGYTSPGYWGGECHWDGYGAVTTYTGASGRGTSGAPGRAGLLDPDTVIDGVRGQYSEGGGGGGYPNGGKSQSAGQPFYIGSRDAKATRSASIQYGVSNNLTATIQLVGIFTGTRETSGTYDLVDKKAPETPTATSNGGFKANGSDETYTITWNSVKDIGSENIFQVNSYNMTNNQVIHKSVKYSVVYTSGLKEYRYIVDGNPNTKVTNLTGTSVGTKTTFKASPVGTETYVHIVAVDNSGNYSDTLTITISAKLVTYNLNNSVVNNRYGDAFSTTAVENEAISSTVLRIGEQTIVRGNPNSYSRHGYRHLVAKHNGDDCFIWNTKPDGTGTTYYSGDIITYESISGGKLTLYAIWEPLVNKVTYNYNKPVTGNYNPKANAMKTEKFDTDSTSEVDTKGKSLEQSYRFDQSITINTDPTLKGWTFGGWFTDGKKVTGTLRFNKSLLNDIPKDIEIVARWTPNTYYIDYKGNDTEYNIYGDKTTTTFTGTTASTTCTYDKNVTLATNGFSKKGYIFKEWNTKSDGTGTSYKDGETLEKPNFVEANNGRYTLYAIWEPIRYQVKFNSNDDTLGNWNDPDSYYQTADNLGQTVETIRYDQTVNLLDCKFKRTAPITLCNNSEVKQDYKFMGWANNKNTWTVDFNNKATIKNFRGVTENNKVYNLYALWEREIKLTFNMNGGKYKGNSDDVILNAKIYNSKYNYTFNIAGGLTGKVTNTQTAQNIAIDAYGEYDSDGINTLYTRRDSNGLLYRFIGWALSSDATEPISNMSPYDTNPESTYEIYSNTTLYAVWEPVLTMNVSLNRALGDLTFNNGTAPATSLQAITASTPNPLLTVIIKPGEEGRYSVETYNTGLTFKTAFDTRITDVYTHEGTWTDNLNPSTSEDLVAGQGHGIDRAFNIDSAYSVRSFRIPQYLGTDKSYSSSIGVNKYGVLFDISKHSYFYNKIHGTDEEIRVTGLIFITPEQSNTTDDVDSVLDALRTKLKIRLK